MVYAQDFRQLFGGERRQLSGQLPGLRAVKGRSGAGYRQGGAFGHRFGTGEEYLHDLSVVVARLLRKAGERDEGRHRKIGGEQVVAARIFHVNVFADAVTGVYGRIDARREPAVKP